MSEHQHWDKQEHDDCPECVANKTSTTPNLRIPKADRWKVENKKVDEAETK